jgi:hypothetical protein
VEARARYLRGVHDCDEVFREVAYHRADDDGFGQASAIVLNSTVFQRYIQLTSLHASQVREAGFPPGVINLLTGPSQHEQHC